MWEPISLNKLSEVISSTENELDENLEKFWSLIRIKPEKWEQPNYGDLGGGFWVVAICGKRIVWYNDIEDGFNISNYKKYGMIESYTCDQYELNQIIWQLYYIDENFRTAGPPKPLT